jgi:hypothetical protein
MYIADQASSADPAKEPCTATVVVTSSHFTAEMPVLAASKIDPYLNPFYRENGSSVCDIATRKFISHVCLFDINKS